MRFGNHSESHNLDFPDFDTVCANRDIAKGEELLIDYRLLFAGGEPFESFL